MKNKPKSFKPGDKVRVRLTKKTMHFIGYDVEDNPVCQNTYDYTINAYMLNSLELVPDPQLIMMRRDDLDWLMKLAEHGEKVWAEDEFTDAYDRVAALLMALDSKGSPCGEL